MNASDAVEYLLAGESAVQGGTASFIHPGALSTILDDLEAFLIRRGIATVGSLVQVAS
jgi:dihydroorotate dehydrogenase (NAD+) catalytic subunit